MYSDENKSSAIAAILNRFDYVLIDTCSLMDPACPVWMDALHNAKDYRKKREPIIVPRRCYDELKRHSRDKRDDSRRIAAKRGLKILRKAKWDRLLAVAKKDNNENFADNAIYVKVCADRLFSRILIITQDKSLASDLLALNKLRSQQGRPVEVYKLVNDGKMVPNLGEPADDRGRELKAGGRLNQTSSPTQKPAKAPEKEGTSLSDIQAADARLCAVLSNPNYPDEKKKTDAEAQLKTLQSLSASERSKLKLKMGIDRLQEFLHPAKAAPKAVKPAEKAPSPKKAEPAKKEEPVKKERLWYGKGKTIKEGLLDCAKHYGILFRSASVKYFPEAHGPLDLTENDLETICKELEAKLGEEKATASLKGTDFIAQKHEDHFHCFIDVLNSTSFLAVKAEPKPTAEKSKPAKKTAPKTVKAEEPKSESPVKETAEKAVKETAKKPAKTAKKPAKAEEKPEAEKAEPEVKKPAKAPKAKKTAPKEEAPAKEALEAKPEPKKEEPKKADAKAAPLTPFEQAKKNEHGLKCNLKNPNYSSDKKIKAIDKQLALIEKLSPEEISSLSLSPDALKKMREEAENR